MITIAPRSIYIALVGVPLLLASLAFSGWLMSGTWYPLFLSCTLLGCSLAAGLRRSWAGYLFYFGSACYFVPLIAQIPWSEYRFSVLTIAPLLAGIVYPWLLFCGGLLAQWSFSAPPSRWWTTSAHAVIALGLGAVLTRVFLGTWDIMSAGAHFSYLLETLKPPLWTSETVWRVWAILFLEHFVIAIVAVALPACLWSLLVPWQRWESLVCGLSVALFILGLTDRPSAMPASSISPFFLTSLDSVQVLVLFASPVFGNWGARLARDRLAGRSGRGTMAGENP